MTEAEDRDGIINPLKDYIFTWDETSQTTRAHIFLENPVIIESMNIYKEMVIDDKAFEDCLANMNSGDINITDAKGRTLLHGLCLFGNLSTIKLLVKYNVKIDCFDDNGFGPLHFCAISDRHYIADYLVKHCKANLDVKAKSRCHGRYPVHIAAMSSSLNMFKLLVGYQLSVHDHKMYVTKPINLFRRDNPPNGKPSRTPLWLATYYKHASIAHLIIELQSGRDIIEHSEPELSFIYRAGVKLPMAAQQLMNSLIHTSPERNSRLFWVEESTLFNKFGLDNNFDNLDPGLHFAHGAVTNPQHGINAPLIKLLSHPYMWNIVLIKWEIYGKYAAMLYSLVKWIYIVLWTAIYVSDSTTVIGSYKSPSSERGEVVLVLTNKKSADASMYVLIFASLIVFGVLFCFDLIKALGLKDCVKRFIHHERNVVNEELDILNRAPMPLPLCMAMTEERNVRRQESKWAFSYVSVYSLFESFVDLFSFCMVVYYIFLFSYSNDGRQGGTTNEIRDYINSVLLICMYIMGLGTLRFIKYFAYLIEVLRQAVIDIAKWLIVFGVFYIPVIAILWESIYNYNHISAVTNNQTSNVTSDVRKVIVETFRRTHVNYDYGTGKKAAESKGNWEKVEVLWWWYATLFYWFALGNIILINMLIALMSDSISKIKEKSKMICAYNTMIFQTEVEAMAPNMVINRMKKFIKYKERSDKEDKRVVCELPLSNDNIDVSNKDLVNNLFKCCLTEQGKDTLIVSRYTHDSYVNESYLSKCHTFVANAEA